ncbi:hypothetical protein [Hasllibacter sp. MH4015]|uniref:hypothetical protein n=1 Tax=Hasllibacter sp. MH4015 TaxID=2854029 RepID=UPI001CD7E15C|nr:hypothetical protein [Hasllibacter sp. MH4015]
MNIRGVEKPSGAELYTWTAVDEAFLTEPKLVIARDGTPTTFDRTGHHMALDHRGEPIYVVSYTRKTETRIVADTFWTALSFTVVALFLMVVVSLAPFESLGWIAVNFEAVLLTLFFLSLGLIVYRVKNSAILSILLGVIPLALFFSLLVFDTIVFDNPIYSLTGGERVSADQLPLAEGASPNTPPLPIDYGAVGERVLGLVVELWGVLILLIPWSLIVTTLLGMDALKGALTLLRDTLSKKDDDTAT